MHSVRSRLFIIGIVILLGVGTALAVRTEERAIQMPSVRAKTATERRETLAALQYAWESRLQPYSPENQREERAFLNRLALFVRASHGREVYGDACRLWNQAYHDHASRYEHFIGEGN